MNIKGKLFVICCSIFMMGCSSIAVNYDFDPEYNFSAIKTYDWLPVPEKVKTDELTIKHIRRAVNTQLEEKGLKLTSGNPDMLIAVHGSKEKKVDVEEYEYGYSDFGAYHAFPRWGAGPFLGRPGPDYYEQRSGTEKYEYEVGTLILDFVNAKNKELIWRGTASGVIDPGKTAQDINEAVTKLLENFPPAKSK